MISEATLPKAQSSDMVASFQHLNKPYFESAPGITHEVSCAGFSAPQVLGQPCTCSTMTNCPKDNSSPEANLARLQERLSIVLFWNLSTTQRSLIKNRAHPQFTLAYPQTVSIFGRSTRSVNTSILLRLLHCRIKTLS